MWQEIAASCGITIEIAKTKWKNLRDNFRAEVRKINKGKSGDAGGSQADHGSNWVWFKNLLFLKDQMVSRKMSSSLQSSCTVTTGPSCALSEDSQRDTQEIDDVTEIEENSEIEGQTPATDQDTPTGSKTRRQNIPLRGHRDRGRLFSNDSTNDEDVLNNEGNFRKLIRFRVDSGDNLLKKNLENSKAHATT
ncbi:unnamed protein product [Acanthoscelides obtectus]|uniref:MADF domain-containing protein n=1 Tax=Acanthoscelides obtectus TaxID=200917 RepID=A0A9P0LB34_ACAOB|nr:unnamed protein product [Acanthoscelides obtectus]CAK1640475.1 hypothetical protein AOBTE_LOCUS11745 [Acanthoscelides obtectus]